MKAILMAAGVGSRLAKDLDRPKCTWNVGGIPLIRRTVKMLLDNNISVSIVVGYKKEHIFDLLKDFNVTYYYNPFFRATNSLASLWFARQELSGSEDIILSNADVFWEQDILNLILSDKHCSMILGDKTRTTVGDFFFETCNDMIVNYGKKLDVVSRTCEYVGIAKITNSFLPIFKEHLEDLIAHEAYHLWWENVLYEYCAQNPVYVQDVQGHFWGEIDCIQDYNRISTYVLHNNHREIER